MATAPVVEIDMAAFWADPYPTLRALRAEAPIAYVPQLGGIVFTRHADIMASERNIAVFSSDQPDGLMTTLMGHNMMRKDGAPHRAERAVIAPSLTPKTVAESWQAQFQAHADRIVGALAPKGHADLFRDYALPLSGEALKAITGLTNITYAEMDAWSQAMIDGISNYTGDGAVEARCHAATAAIDAAIDDRLPAVRDTPDASLLSVILEAGLPMESVRANVKLAISGGQNEPRDAIAGAIWALLTHPEYLAMARAGEITWLQVFEEYARWLSPIGMSPRRIATPHSINGIDLAEGARVFFMFGSANRDEEIFDAPDRFDPTRDTAKSIAFGAGPHFCIGAWASRTLIAEVAMPTLFARLKDIKLAEDDPVRLGGWAFRGVLNLPVRWGV